jgi:hypothetical protein
MPLQIGTKGKFDTSHGTITGAPMNSSHTLLALPASIAVDPTNVYGYYGHQPLLCPRPLETSGIERSSGAKGLVLDFIKMPQ